MIIDAEHLFMCQEESFGKFFFFFLITVKMKHSVIQWEDKVKEIFQKVEQKEMKKAKR